MTRINHWYQKPCLAPCKKSAEQAQERQNTLTKPAGSLGRLEDIAIAFAGWQGTEKPTLENIMVRVFAADHGICAQNISAFPQEVTAQMVINFIHGGAAISVLSEQENADFAVVNMGLLNSLVEDQNSFFDKKPSNKKTSDKKLINTPIAAGTKDFSVEPAMSEQQAQQALQTGQDIIHARLEHHPQLFIGGEMGIGNTSSASAIYCALLGISAKQACGPGTGIDAQGVMHKSQIIQTALEKHQLSSNDALDIMCKVGGFEIAALTGAYIAAAQNKIPSLIDGFISTASALLAVNLSPSCREWLFFSHQSAEPAHKLALQHLNATPLLDIGMRLGEGSGAAVCIALLRSALALHQNMATFSEAAVAGAQK